MIQSSQENISYQISYKISHLNHCYQTPKKYDQYLSISNTKENRLFHGKRMLYFLPRQQYHPTEFNLHFKRLSFRKGNLKAQRNSLLIYIYFDLYEYFSGSRIDMWYHFDSQCPDGRYVTKLRPPYFAYLDDVEKFLLCLSSCPNSYNP